jgi:hypothetical protein
MIMDRRSSLGSLGCVMGALTLVACAAQGGEDDAASKAMGALEAAPELMVTPFDDPAGIGDVVGSGEIRRTISSARQYQRVFGHAVPDGVSLRGGRIAIFYSPGVQNTGGYEASFERVEVRGRTLVVTTRLTSPGENCRVTEALTHPYALATLRRPRNVTRVRFVTDDVVRDCNSVCIEQVLCVQGAHFDSSPDVCACVPDEKITCGGFAGRPCPDKLTCVDDPSDDCDPNNGGADCGGICQCVEIALCIQGSHFDSNACECVPDEQKVTCGGFGGFPCPGTLSCVDDPSDDCDPNNGGADCGGICQCVEKVLCVKGSHFDSSADVCACVPDPTQDPCATVKCSAGTHCQASDDGGAGCVSDGPFCGGIAGIDCPGLGQCGDDPNDGCDPKNGGADCGGRCTCEALAKCQGGYIFDSSPEVCDCVLEDPCIATTCLTGTTCQVIDGNAYCLSDGTEACGTATCGKGTSCCNASCGVCAEPGFACIQIACLPTQ